MSGGSGGGRTAIQISLGVDSVVAGAGGGGGFCIYGSCISGQTYGRSI